MSLVEWGWVAFCGASGIYIGRQLWKAVRR